MGDRDRTFSRRGLFAAGGAAVVGATGGVLLGYGAASAAPGHVTVALAKEPTTAMTTEPFTGAHQSGIETIPQTFTTFIGMNLNEPTVANMRGAMKLLTQDAERLTRGEASLADSQPALARIPARLTVSVGFGHPLFAKLRLPVPAFFPELPSFTTDAFEPGWEQSELVVQVGTDDAATLAHTVRTLLKTLRPLTTVAWVQRGFRSDSPANPGAMTTRNLMGQVDGTVNPAPLSDDFRKVVWVDAGPDWAVGGTVLVLRRIRMLLDAWESLDRGAQELMIGRRLDSGAPLTGMRESDSPDFAAVDSHGLEVIPSNSHIAVATARTLDETIMRRPYNYDDGFIGGVADIGLVFAAYMRDPNMSFIPMQERIAANDVFNTWNTTVGSSTYVYPRGAQEGEYLGESLLG